MNSGGGTLKAVAMGILGLITFTFGLLVFLFVLRLFPTETVGSFLGAVLEAGAAILRAIPALIQEVLPGD